MELVIQVTKLNHKAVIPHFYNLYLSADTLDELTTKIRKHIDPIFSQVVRLRLLCRTDAHYTDLPYEWRVTVENLIY